MITGVRIRSSSFTSLSRPTSRSRSLANRMPRTSSLSSPTTGKREWPDSMITGNISSSEAPAGITTMCERGTMTSRT